MKILFLLPPSEGKNNEWLYSQETLSFSFQKPFDFLQNLWEKDLKCSGKRFLEAQNLNTNIQKWPFLPAIQRYNWVMYNAIWYEKMSKKWQKYFDEHFLIFSGMYGILRPQDLIWNYKLPIEAKNLSLFWKDQMTQTLQNIKADLLIDFLPLSYKKMIDFSRIWKKVLEINFIDTSSWKKIAHGVKKIKWEYIQYVCEHQNSHMKDLWNYVFDGGKIVVEQKKK